MNQESIHRVSVIFKCRHGDAHPLCVTVSRGVPPELRCEPDKPTGYGRNGGGQCLVPADLTVRVERQLNRDLLEAKRRGYVLIQE